MNEMSTELTTKPNELSTILASAGQAANEAARASAFTDYRSRKASNTIARQDTDLATFAAYLAQTTGSDAITGDDLARDPQVWRGVTWGLVDGFAKWALLKGYAVGTVNLKLSTVKTYAKLAAKGGGGILSRVGPHSLSLRLQPERGKAD